MLRMQLSENIITENKLSVNEPSLECLVDGLLIYHSFFYVNELLDELLVDVL